MNVKMVGHVLCDVGIVRIIHTDQRPCFPTECLLRPTDTVGIFPMTATAIWAKGKTMARINLNERIKVRLTDLGKDIYYHQFDDLNEMAGRCVLKPEYPKTDEDGYTEFQLWAFIELYGEHIGIAKPNVIYPNEIVYAGEPNTDAAPVVRCKDCKRHEDEEIGMVYCPNIVGGWVEDDWFCAGGEPKMDEEKE